MNTIGNAQAGAPTQGSLADLMQTTGGMTMYAVDAIVGNNLGHRTLLCEVPIHDLRQISIVPNSDTVEEAESSQRRLDRNHAFKLAQFMLKGLVQAAREELPADYPNRPVFNRILHYLGESPYSALQPIVVNVRSAGQGGANLKAEVLQVGSKVVGYRVHLGLNDLFYVIDGQHRRMGIQLLLEFLEEVIRAPRMYPKKKASLYPYDGDERRVPDDEHLVWEAAYQASRTSCIVIEAHLGLEVPEERQLFYDLNALGKTVETSQALRYDSSNPVNQWVKDHLIDRMIRIAKGDKVDWGSEDTGAMTHKDLVAVNAPLFLNKTNTNGASQSVVDERSAVALRFWEAVTQIDGFGEADARDRTVAAQPVVLKALAKLTFDFAFGRQANQEHLDRLLDGITEIDLSHENPMWRYYQMDERERRAEGIADLIEYLPAEEGGNRDLGSFASDAMRFGAKHNDIVPIIGDMIRWKLQLPARNAGVPTAT